METQTFDRPVNFAVIGLDHPHVFGQTKGLMEAGATLVGSATGDDSSSVAKEFRSALPDVPVRDRDDLLADPTIDLIVTAGVPSQRAGISVAALRAGKDVVSDKPGCTTFEQLDELRAAVAETGRFWSVTFSERFDVASVARAGEIVRSGALGEVIQTLGLGPHREGSHLAGGSGRPEWFYDEREFGGILIDIASHQIDQFLWFTGASTAEVAASSVGNYAHPDRPGFHDFGEVMLRSERAHGYVRVDWFTPDGLPTWGDGRLFILGTKGYVELRKYVDVGVSHSDGSPEGNHLIWVDEHGMHREECADRPITHYADLLHDVRHRTQTAAPQEHTFEVMRLALEAQRVAVRRGALKP